MSDVPAAPEERPRPSLLRQALAWGVHLYTGLGVVLAGGMAVLIFHGRPADFAATFLLMLIAVAIDATDGVLARAVRVKEVLPGFDGTLLDNLIDFLTFTFLPLLLLWRAQVVPEPWMLILPLLASAYGFCQVEAKTADGYFRGFPSYWNIVALYLYLWQPPLGIALALLWLLALLTFVPSVYIYPTRSGGWINVATNVLGAIWAGQLLWIVVEMLRSPDGGVPEWLLWSSLVYPAFYMGASWVISVRRWMGMR